MPNTCSAPPCPALFPAGRARCSSRVRVPAFALCYLAGPSFAHRILHSRAGAAHNPGCSLGAPSSQAELSGQQPPGESHLGSPQVPPSQPLLSGLHQLPSTPGSATGAPSRSEAPSRIYPPKPWPEPSSHPQKPLCAPAPLSHHVLVLPRPLGSLQPGHCSLDLGILLSACVPL